MSHPRAPHTRPLASPAHASPPVLTPARRLARPRSRIEYFVFSLLAEMQGHEVQLYAILRDGALNRYPEVNVGHESRMPSGGDLSNPDDLALVKDLEDKMINSYGTTMVELKCKAALHSKEANLRWKRLGPKRSDLLTFAASGGKTVDLEHKMFRPVHVDALFAAVDRYQVTGLNLAANQLGAEGGALVAAALKTNTTLTELRCAQLGRPSNQGH